MMRMLKKNMFRAVLFLLLTVLMVAWVSTAVIAGGDPTRSLSLTFDDANILSCTLTVKDRHSGTVVEGFNNKPIVSGEVYQISVGNDVTVTVSTGMGYKVTVQDATGDVNVNKNGLSWNLHWDNYTEEFSATLGTTPRTYKVNVLDYDQEGDISYYIADSSKADGWTIDDLNDPNAPFTYTYGDSTELPSVQRTGFIFEGWRVVGGNLSDVRKIDGKYYIQLSGSDEFDVKDEFSVYPILTPIVYDVYRYDFVYDAKNHMNDYLGERLSIAIRGQAPMDSKITGLYLMDDDLNGIHKTYPGYLVMGAEEYDYEPGKIVNKPWGEGVDNNPNIVNRVYRAIVYDLVFMDDSGNPLAGYEGKTYTYADPTDIADPTRTGYTFIGWKVEIYKNGTWVVVDPDANASNGTLTSPGLSLGIHKAILNEETGERNDPNAIYASEKNPEGKYEIRLTANWTPNVYNIDYDWNVGGNADLEAALEALNPSLPAQFTFDSKNAAGEKKLAIANAIRNGYTFDGWKVEIYTETDDGWKWVQVKANGEFPTENESVDPILDLSLQTALHASDVRLTANWTKRVYSVALNPGDGVEEGYTASIEGVTFDEPLRMPNDFVCPQKVGFTFLGYFSAPEGGKQYINAEGESVCSAWDLYEDTDNVITLYAQWSRNSYNLTVDVNELPAGTVIEIVTSEGTRYSYTDAPVSLPYETSFTVAFTMPEGYKLVKWNGTSVVHTTAYTSASLVIGAADMTVTATILPVAVVPAVTPDYLPENAVLNFAADGEYVLSVQGMEDILVSLQNGAIRINGERADAFVIPEEYFGKTVSIVYKGDGVVHADSSPVTVAIVARPESPRPEVELDRIDDTDDRKLTVYMYDGLSYVYEFAISRTNDPTTITQWFSNGTGAYTFADLQPGTAYYIFIRTKATADAPHGQIYITRNPYYTPTKDYVDETVDDLNSLIGESDGDITSALIQGAIDQINQWASQQPLPDTFYQDVENLINRIKNEQLAFAQSQDAKIAALEAFLNECLASGAFTEAHQQALKDLCANAVTGITAGTTEEEIQQIFETTMVSMEMIPVTYRYDVNHIIQLISKLGLSQESKLTLIRLNDIEALKQSVQEAIRSGGVIRGNVELLKTLEVVAAYKFKLESVTAPDAEDVFTIRLTIPADLQNYTGLQIAYYVETANGITVEYIESRIEGNEIVFETDKVGDFVILADSTVDLTAIIIALGAILACQIIAIAVIMITRFNAKKKITDAKAKHYSFILPAFLAVHFLPVGGETLALLMGAAVILLQVILMILLLKSDIIHLGKKKKQEPTDEEATQSDNNAYSVAETEPLQPVEEQPVEDSEEARIAAFLYGNEDAEQEAGESDPYADDPFAAYDDAEPTAEEAYATEDEEVAETFGEDFIEPAANPYYSLPEDEAGETEQSSEETGTDPYGEESAWDDRPYVEEYATEEYTTEEYTDEYTEEYADEQPLGEAVAEDFSLEDDFAESYDAMMGDAEAQDQDLIDADTEAYESDYVEEEPYDEGSFEDAYVQEFYSDEAAPEEAPAEELSYAEEEYTVEPVFEAPVYEPDEAEEDTDPMYRYDE